MRVGATTPLFHIVIVPVAEEKLLENYPAFDVFAVEPTYAHPLFGRRISLQLLALKAARSKTISRWRFQVSSPLMKTRRLNPVSIHSIEG